MLRYSSGYVMFAIQQKFMLCTNGHIKNFMYDLSNVIPSSSIEDSHNFRQTRR